MQTGALLADLGARHEPMRSLGGVMLAWLPPGPVLDRPAPRDCQLLFQTERCALGSARGKPFRLGGGTWTAGISSRLKVENVLGGTTLSLRFPLDLLSRRLAGQIQSRGPIALPIRGAARLCLDLARSSLSEPEPMSPGVAQAVGESLLELAKLAIIDQLCETRVESVRETVRARIQAFVLRNLVDPELTIDRIAERLQCTKRYLHKVFSDEGQTLNHYIWTQRLERCRTELARQDLADKSITEIAFSCGFSNAAHFSRSFRARFGQPPRAYRRMVRQA